MMPRGCLWVAILVLVSVPQMTLHAEQASDNDFEIVEELEFLEEDETESTSLSLTALLGRLHPAVVHFPIGWLVLLLIMDSTAFVLRKTTLVRWGPFLLGGTVLSMLPAIATGLLRYSAYSEPDSLALDHRNLIFIMAALCLSALIVRLVKGNDLRGIVRWIYLLLILSATGLILMASHHGGKLVFGEAYLPF